VPGGPPNHTEGGAQLAFRGNGLLRRKVVGGDAGCNVVGNLPIEPDATSTVNHGPTLQICTRLA